jgi:hypothetical protein
MFTKLSILDADLPSRVLASKMPVLKSRNGDSKTLRSVILSSVSVYMDMTKSAVVQSLQLAMAEAVQLRIQRIIERGQPSAESAGVADLIPDFSPTRVALDEASNAI